MLEKVNKELLLTRIGYPTSGPQMLQSHSSAKRPKTYLSLSAFLDLFSLFQGHELVSNFY